VGGISANSIEIVINNKSVLALIPARGGSKGLRRKNVLPLAGKPLIAWSIEAAHGSKYIDKCIVSTDDNEIMDVAKSYNCNVPFIRPKKFALDETPSFEVIAHAVKYLNNKKSKFDYIILLEPTSPLRNSNDIDSALEKLDFNRDIADSIVGVSEVVDAHPVFDVRINNTGLIEPYALKNFALFRRQEIETLYFFEGSVYVSDIQVLLKEKSFYHDRTLPFVVPRWKSLEIDEIIDLLTAETVLKNLSLIKKGNYE